MYNNSIICAGVPRSGTTLMFRALAGLKAGGTTPRDYQGPIVKTHSFRPGHFKGAQKAIFMFSDPVDAVVSTRLHRYTKHHFYNCGAKDRDPETTNIYEEDALNYERMMRAWMRPLPFDTLCIKYETMYSHLDLIKEFIGYYLYFPPKTKRVKYREIIDREDLVKIEKSYESMIAIYKKVPDICIYGRDISL